MPPRIAPCRPRRHASHPDSDDSVTAKERDLRRQIAALMVAARFAAQLVLQHVIRHTGRRVTAAALRRRPSDRQWLEETRATILDAAVRARSTEIRRLERQLQRMTLLRTSEQARGRN